MDMHEAEPILEAVFMQRVVEKFSLNAERVDEKHSTFSQYGNYWCNREELGI